MEFRSKVKQMRRLIGLGKGCGQRNFWRVLEAKSESFVTNSEQGEGLK